ncbi:MAG: hypothetical protein AAGG68_05405 [Bacteroidota bacterium]
MLYRELLKESQSRIKKRGEYVNSYSPNQLFVAGAKWMLDFSTLPKFKENRYSKRTIQCYGLGKYGLCISSTILYLALINEITILDFFIAIFFFYFIESHLVFVFPLLIDNQSSPLKKSILMAYKIGLPKVFINILPIAGYMILGLFKVRKPFYNWHIGCGAIVIWYENEI